MNLIALALLVTSLLFFIGFHLGDWIHGSVESKPMAGWELWKNAFEVVRDSNLRGLPHSLFITMSALIVATVLICGGPFAVKPLAASRALWWGATVASAASFAGFGGFMAYHMAENAVHEPGSGFFCLLAAQMLNFTGLLFIRREVPAAPEVDPA
jgi:hypothetical protein